MARIAGVDLPRQKRIDIALRYIYGIGPYRATEVVQQAKMDPTIRVKDLSEADVAKLRAIIDRDFKVEGDLRRELGLNIKRLQEIGAYRGLRHRRGLPARGQRTRTNARTKRGTRKTVAGKKKAKAK